MSLLPIVKDLVSELNTNMQSPEIVVATRMAPFFSCFIGSFAPQRNDSTYVIHLRVVQQRNNITIQMYQLPENILQLMAIVLSRYVQTMQFKSFRIGQVLNNFL